MHCTEIAFCFHVDYRLLFRLLFSRRLFSSVDFRDQLGVMRPSVTEGKLFVTFAIIQSFSSKLSHSPFHYVVVHILGHPQGWAGLATIEIFVAF